MRILHRLNLWACLVLIAIIYFYFLLWNFKSVKKLFLKFGIYFTKIVGRNFCDLMLFCQICENLYPQITWFSNILLINSRNNFLDCKKLFLRTLFFSMKHCLQNFPVYSFRGHFFGHDIIYLTICECLFLQKLTPGTPLARFRGTPIWRIEFSGLYCILCCP